MLVSWRVVGYTAIESFQILSARQGGNYIASSLGPRMSFANNGSVATFRVYPWYAARDQKFASGELVATPHEYSYFEIDVFDWECFSKSPSHRPQNVTSTQNMEFNPNNSIVQLCLQGMDMEAEGNREEAGKLFLRAWNEASNDFEKYLAAYYLARQQIDVSAKLKWFETALQLALKIDNHSTNSALPSIYSNIAGCYENLNEVDSAKKYAQLGLSAKRNPTDNGPFYHGTKADLKTGDLLTAGFNSNYHSTVVMNHIYFTALTNGAGLAAELAPGDGQARVYVVEPTGSFESDPNVTDKKFPGNPTRSYRSSAPLKIVGEVTDWVRLTPEELKRWREKLAKIESSKGKIIN